MKSTKYQTEPTFKVSPRISTISILSTRAKRFSGVTHEWTARKSGGVTEWSNGQSGEKYEKPRYALQGKGRRDELVLHSPPLVWYP